MLYTVAVKRTIIVRDSPFCRGAEVQVSGVGSVQIIIAKCEGVVTQGPTQGHDSNTIIANCNLVTASDVDG